MADFVAVLRKTLDGLSEATPPMREKVYDKARSTIAAKLAAMVPPPPAAVVERQKRALEDAIASIELDYSEPAKAVPESADDPLAELENVFAAMKNPVPRPAVMAPLPKPAEIWPKHPSAEASPALPVSPPAAREPVDEIVDDQPDSHEDGEADYIAADPTPERKRNYGGLIAAAIVLVVIAGGGYGVWLNKDAFGEMIGLN
ncbi:MAG: hypothetical protein H0T56_02870, partial [Pseudaminobacter sp.]|nr:hypothetical protein [Pseudaminobacter sp.]